MERSRAPLPVADNGSRGEQPFEVRLPVEQQQAGCEPARETVIVPSKNASKRPLAFDLPMLPAVDGPRGGGPFTTLMFSPRAQ